MVDAVAGLEQVRVRFRARAELATHPLKQSALPLLDQMLGQAESTQQVFKRLDRQYREQNKSRCRNRTGVGCSIFRNWREEGVDCKLRLPPANSEKPHTRPRPRVTHSIRLTLESFKSAECCPAFKQ